jgi:hypothetical protein
MTVIRTFLDAGVLITAARDTGEDADKALQILKSSNRKVKQQLHGVIDSITRSRFAAKARQARISA